MQMIIQAIVSLPSNSTKVSLRYKTDLTHPLDLYVEARARAFEKYQEIHKDLDVVEVIVDTMISK